MWQAINNSLLVYPSGNLEDKEAEREDLRQIIRINGAVHELLSRKIDAETFADIVEANGVNMDNYLDDVCSDFDFLEL